MAHLRAGPSSVVLALDQRACKSLGVLFTAAKYEAGFAIGVPGTQPSPESVGSVAHGTA